jgi:hypothetical protein
MYINKARCTKNEEGEMGNITEGLGLPGCELGSLLGCGVVEEPREAAFMSLGCG